MGRRFLPPARLRLAIGLALGTATTVADAQTIRRPEHRAFRFSITPYAGLGWGGSRARETDPLYCVTTPCITHRLGGSPVVGLEVHVPLPGAIALGFVAAGARPNRLYCSSGGLPRANCDVRGRATALRGSALLLWRFRARAPMYVGFGPAVSYVDPGPVYIQRSAKTEWGGSFVAAYDLRAASWIALRLAWWNYLLLPSAADLGAAATPTAMAWDSHVALGISASLGSATVRRPPRTITP